MTSSRMDNSRARGSWTRLLGWTLSGVLAFGAGVMMGLQLRTPVTGGPIVDEAAQIEYFRRVRRFMDAGRYLDALRALQQIPDSSPFAAEARFREGQIYHQLHRWTDAERLWRRALELDPLLPEVGWHLLEMLFIEERLQEARELALQQFRIEPEPRDRVLWLLEIVRQEHERVAPAEAVKILAPVQVRDPENHYVLRIIGRNYIILGRIKEGIQLLERALRIAPRDLDTWFFLVWGLYEQGEIDRVSRLWPKLPPTAWDDPRFLRYRGRWLENRGRIEEALAAYQKAVALDPYDRKARYQLAQVLRRLGKEQEADEHSAKAVQIDQARERLGQLYLDTRRIDNDPTPDVCLEFAECWEIMGEQGQAEAWRAEARFRRERQMGRPFENPLSETLAKPQPPSSRTSE